MTPLRASSPALLVLLALVLAGVQPIGLAAASEPGSDLDAMAYGASPDASNAPGRAQKKSPRTAKTAAEIPVIGAAPSLSDRPPSFEENSPGLLAVIGFDNRRFAVAPPRPATTPLDARASVIAASLAPLPPLRAVAPPPAVVMEENSPGLLAAIGLDNRVALPPPPPRAALAAVAVTGMAVPPVAVQPVVQPIVPVVMPVSHGPEYRLGAGDKLRVVVFGQEGLTNTYSIDAGGAITMPLIGRVSARGQTPGALADEITARLRKGFIREPSVAVEIESYRPFFILGEVAAPGQYPYVPNMSVEAAVAIAGGFSPRARRDSVTVTHPAEGGLLRAVVPLGTPLSPGDTVLVSERWF